MKLSLIDIAMCFPAILLVVLAVVFAGAATFGILKDRNNK